MKKPKKIHLDTSFYKIPGWVYFITIVSNFKASYFIEETFNNKLIECLEKERKE